MMPILIEGISVVVRRETVKKQYPGGYRGFKRLIENMRHCSDRKLIVVYFMTPPDVKEFVDYLEANGLRYLQGHQCVDVAVVDQQVGCLCNCDWIKCGKCILDDGITVKAAWAGEHANGDLEVPEGWRYELSLSEQFSFVPTADEAHGLKYLRYEDGCDVYLNVLSGRETFVWRTHTKNEEQKGEQKTLGRRIKNESSALSSQIKQRSKDGG